MSFGLSSSDKVTLLNPKLFNIFILTVLKAFRVKFPMNSYLLLYFFSNSKSAKFETTNGTKTTFKVTDEQASEFVLAIADALSSNSKTIVDLVFGQLKALPGFDEILTMPVEAEKYISDNMIESLNKFAQDIKDIATTVTKTDEDNNEIKYNPLQEKLKE